LRGTALGGSSTAVVGTSNERFEVVVARDLRADGRVHREPTEEIEVVLVPIAELRAAALRGELVRRAVGRSRSCSRASIRRRGRGARSRARAARDPARGVDG
jgi:hypothetical protein